MKFVDEAIIEMHAGNGGDGCASFGSSCLPLAQRCAAAKLATGAPAQ